MRSGGRIPILTLILIAANIAAAFAMLIHNDLAYDFGFRPNQPSLLSAFTSLFLHANVLHLLGNMIFLAAVGAAVELSTGALRFAGVYFLSGLVGVLAHFLITRQAADPVPYVGASGAIAGCAAYYTIRYTTLKVPLAPHLAMPVLAITIVWLILQIAGGFIQIGDSAGTAYWAHIGGFATGLVLSFVFKAPDLGQLKLGHEVLDRMNARGPAAAVAAAESHLRRHPNDAKALWDLANARDKLGEKTKEADTLLRLLDVVSVDQQPEVLLRIAQCGYVSRIPLVGRLQMADRHRTSAPAVSRALLSSVIEGPDDVQKPDAMLSLAALEREEDPDRAEEILRELQAKYPLHAAVDMARKRGWLT